MTLFKELPLARLETGPAGEIVGVDSNSVADDIGLQAGDYLLAVNDQPVSDVIDVQFYTAEEAFELLIRRGEELLLFEAQRPYGRPLGLHFAHPTFDTDIRRCNNLCEFCFVLQMAPRFRRTLYIKDDDYRYSFLFGHYVTLTNLSEHDWWRIETMGLSPLYVSVHVTNLARRRQFLRNESAPDIMDQLRWLTKRGIEVHTQLVIVPEVNDDEWMARSIEDLAGLWPGVRSVSVVPVGLTSHHKYGLRHHTREEAAATLAFVESLQPRYQEAFGARFVYPTDEWYLVTGRDVPPLTAYDDQALHENGLGMVRAFLDEWAQVRAEISLWQRASGRTAPHDAPALTLATGRLFAGILADTAAELATIGGLDLEVVIVRNERLGEGITAAGLLLAEDVIAQLRQKALADVVVLPRLMFDHPRIVSLDDVSPQEVADQLGRPVALADSMGDVWDVVTGQSKTIHRPTGPA